MRAADFVELVVVPAVPSMGEEIRELIQILDIDCEWCADLDVPEQGGLNNGLSKIFNRGKQCYLLSDQYAQRDIQRVHKIIKMINIERHAQHSRANRVFAELLSK